MNKRRACKWVGLAAGGGVLLQITACLGPDPQFLVTTLALNSLVSNIVTTVFQTFLSFGNA